MPGPHDDRLGNLNSLLQSAVIYGDISLSTYLLEAAETDINATNEFGETLLLQCCKGRHLELLRVIKCLEYVKLIIDTD